MVLLGNNPRGESSTQKGTGSSCMILAFKPLHLNSTQIYFLNVTSLHGLIYDLCALMKFTLYMSSSMITSKKKHSSPHETLQRTQG